MQIILEALTQEHLRQLRALVPFAELLSDDNLNVSALDQLMVTVGYRDNDIVRVLAANIGITDKQVQLIVNYMFEDSHEGGTAVGTFYVYSPTPGHIDGSF